MSEKQYAITDYTIELYDNKTGERIYPIDVNKTKIKHEKQDIDNVFEELMSLYNNKNIELGKTYYVSQWSYNPICDGYFSYTETIRYKKNVNGINLYYTGNNYRGYFAWDIYESKEEAIAMSDFKDTYAYDWGVHESKLVDYVIRNKLIQGGEL